MLGKIEVGLYVISFLVTVIILPPGEELFGGEEQAYGEIEFESQDYQWLLAKNVNPRPITLEGFSVQVHLNAPLATDSQVDREADSTVPPQSLSLLVIDKSGGKQSIASRTYVDTKRSFEPLPLRVLCQREEDQLAGKYLTLALFFFCVGISGSRYLAESLG